MKCVIRILEIQSPYLNNIFVGVGNNMMGRMADDGIRGCCSDVMVCNSCHTMRNANMMGRDGSTSYCSASCNISLGSNCDVCIRILPSCHHQLPPSS
jgi:hypothetical protein